MQGPEARYERAGCDVDISNDVKWQAIEGNNDDKENKICGQFEEIYDPVSSIKKNKTKT
jgi:hypothetical protein